MQALDSTRLSRASRSKLRSVAADEAGGRDSFSLRRLVLIQNSMLHAPRTSSSSSYYATTSSLYVTEEVPSSTSTPPPSPADNTFVFPDLAFADPQTLEAEANWLESVLENLDSDIDLRHAPEGEDEMEIDMSETWFPSPACPCSFYPFNTCICHVIEYPPLPDLDTDYDDASEDGEEYYGPPTPLSTSALDDEDVEGDDEEGCSTSGTSVEQEQVESPTYFSAALRPHSHFTMPVCDFQMIF